jgi:hypothetical protein
MYKFITVARNIMSDTYPMPMYIYKNEENNKYYISRMYPSKSIFQGQTISNQSKFYSLEYPQEISDNDLKQGKTTYWSMTWTFEKIQ